jgi:hypothetical protein
VRRQRQQRANGGVEGHAAGNFSLIHSANICMSLACLSQTAIGEILIGERHSVAICCCCS